ncbi:hypothetical protein CEK69_13855 [Xanthomonas sp. LMG 12462]|nr:hypothetical protein CEK69_13855 [Xanthomonas sp. LMG 12462]
MESVLRQRRGCRHVHIQDAACVGYMPTLQRGGTRIIGRNPAQRYTAHGAVRCNGAAAGAMRSFGA